MKRYIAFIIGTAGLIIVLGLSLSLAQWMRSKAAITRPPVGTTLKVEASAYAPSQYQTDSTPCITAVGTRVREGVAAANFLPIGTIFSINDELYIVEDRMNSRYKSGYIDIWFPSTKEARNFGRQHVQIKIEGYGTPGQALAREENNQVVIQPGILKRMNLRFTAYVDLFSASLQASVTGRGGDVDCFKTE